MGLLSYIFGLLLYRQDTQLHWSRHQKFPKQWSNCRLSAGTLWALVISSIRCNVLPYLLQRWKSSWICSIVLQINANASNRSHRSSNYPCKIGVEGAFTYSHARGSCMPRDAHPEAHNLITVTDTHCFSAFPRRGGQGQLLCTWRGDLYRTVPTSWFEIRFELHYQCLC